MRIAQASIDENGKAKNGKAGNQSGKELNIREWYSSSWNYILRCKNSDKAELIALSAERAVANKHIGYDQNQRNTLRTQAIVVGYDLSRITVDCECDCSSLVTVCCECAGIKIPYNGYNAPTTSTMKSVFFSTGMFDVLADSKYSCDSRYLKRGDILVKAGSHTVIVLDNGELSDSKAKGYIKGIDVSACQMSIDWKKVKASGIRFAVLRCTTKNGKIDDKFKTNLNGCIANRIDYSCYKYSYAETEEQAIDEANKVIDALGGQKMLIWLDLEDSVQYSHIGKAGITKVANAFISACKSRGYDVGIYCNLNWYKNYIDASLRKYPLWIARYGKNDGTLNENYRPNVGELVWQYTSVGKVEGINGNVDLNVMGVK